MLTLIGAVATLTALLRTAFLTATEKTDFVAVNAAHGVDIRQLYALPAP